MGSIYRPKYKNGAGELVESSVWWLKYRVNGAVIREATNPKTTKETLARGQLRVKEGDGERGIVTPAKVNRTTVDALLAGVVRDYRIHKRRSIDKVESRIRLHLAPFFGTRNAASISDELVLEFVERRQTAGASNAEINRELAILCRGYSLAKKTVTMRPEKPTLPESAPRSGFFERQQFEAVCRHLPAALIPPFRFAYETGWRIYSEVLALPWRLVDFDAQEVRLEPGMTKNSEGRVFPFNETVAEILTAQRAHTDAVQRKRNMVIPWVFHRNGKPIKDFAGAWKTACKAAGCPDRIAHDFRRTAVRNLVRSGTPEGIAMQLTGHLTRTVFERYNIVSGSDLRDAVRRLDAARGQSFGQSGPDLGTVHTRGRA